MLRTRDNESQIRGVRTIGMVDFWRTPGRDCLNQQLKAGLGRFSGFRTVVGYIYPLEGEGGELQANWDERTRGAAGDFHS